MIKLTIETDELSQI